MDSSTDKEQNDSTFILFFALLSFFLFECSDQKV